MRPCHHEWRYIGFRWDNDSDRPCIYFYKCIYCNQVRKFASDRHLPLIRKVIVSKRPNMYTRIRSKRSHM